MFYKIPGLRDACEIAALAAAPLFTLFGWRWSRRDGREFQVTARDIEEHFRSASKRILAAGKLEIHESSGRLGLHRYQTSDGEDVWILSLELARISSDSGKR